VFRPSRERGRRDLTRFSDVRDICRPDGDIISEAVQDFYEIEGESDAERAARARVYIEQCWRHGMPWPGWEKLGAMTVPEQLRTLAMRGRNEWPGILYTYSECGLLSDEDLREVLPDAWTEPEFPEDYIGADEWVDWFRRAGFIGDADVPAPTEPMQLYRGAIWENRRGMSWTYDVDQARWFARRFGRFASSHRFVEAHVFACTIEPGGVLARFVDREAEVVVDPAFLPRLDRDAIIETAAVEPQEES
jgi:hypothetical protein